MRRLLFVSALLGMVLFTSQGTRAQDPFAEHYIAGLKGLRSAHLVFGVAGKGPLNLKELADFITVELARALPGFKLIEDPKVPNWLKVSFITTARGSYPTTLNVYRWVTLLDTKTDLLAVTWTRTLLDAGDRPESQASVKEILQTLLTSFAADYIKANR